MPDGSTRPSVAARAGIYSPSDAEWTEVYARVRSGVRYFGRRRGIRPHEVEDVVAIVMRQAYEIDLPKYDPAIGSFAAYVGTLLKWRASRALAKVRGLDVLSPIDEAIDIEDPRVDFASAAPVDAARFLRQVIDGARRTLARSPAPTDSDFPSLVAAALDAIDEDRLAQDKPALRPVDRIAFTHWLVGAGDRETAVGVHRERILDAMARRKAEGLPFDLFARAALGERYDRASICRARQSVLDEMRRIVDGPPASSTPVRVEPEPATDPVPGVSVDGRQREMFTEARDV